MTEYSGKSTLVLRSTEPRATEPAEQRTRFQVITTYTPVDGPAPCSVCPESGAIGQAVGGIRYDSTFLGTWADEPVCLPHLPELIRTLHGLGEGPLTVALYSPCAWANTPRVRRLDHERAELVALLTVAKGPLTAVMLGQLFAASSAELGRIAGVGA